VADVVATRPLRCIVIGGPDVEAFLIAHPRVMFRMMQAQARRLRNANRWRS
jgi:CRP-like cAMP-binding protein